MATKSNNSFGEKKSDQPRTRAKAGDGTQDVRREDRANWFGTSTEVAPEFLNEIEPPSSGDSVPPRTPASDSKDT